MKVLVLATTFPRWRDDTTPPFVYELCKEYVKNGIEIITLAPHHKGAACLEVMDGIKIYRFPYFYPRRFQKLFYDGGVLPNLKHSFLAWLQVPSAILSELRFALWIVKKEKIDVIHSHWIIPSGLVGAICSKYRRTGHLLTVHAADVLTLEKLPFKTRMAAYILNHSDSITAVSSYIGERLLKLVPDNVLPDMRGKTSIVPMGVHTQPFQRNFAAQELKAKYVVDAKFVLLSMGRLVEKKGFKYLIEALPAILAENKDIKLLICGKGPLQGGLENLAKKLNVQDHIIFVGYVGGEKKLDYFAMSDIVIVPSIVASSGDTEGMPVVVLEALAAGKPCIVTDVGGIPDVIKNNENGFVIRQKNPNDIAATVLRLMNNADLRTQVSKNALAISRNYDWMIIGRRYSDTLKEIASA